MSRRGFAFSITTFALSAALVVLLPGINSVVNALQVTFPSAGSNWVSCKLNVLTWSAESTDPEYFSVELLNKDDKLLNGNFQIGNALNTANGSALLTPNCVPPGSGYYFALVNSSHYEKNKPQVFYTSPEFSILPNTSEVPTPSGYQLTKNGTQIVKQAGASTSSTSSADGNSLTGAGGNGTNATSTMTGSVTNGPSLPSSAAGNKSAAANKTSKNGSASLHLSPSNARGVLAWLATLALASVAAAVFF